MTLRSQSDFTIPHPLVHHNALIFNFHFTLAKHHTIFGSSQAGGGWLQTTPTERSPTVRNNGLLGVNYICNRAVLYCMYIEDLGEGRVMF